MMETTADACIKSGYEPDKEGYGRMRYKGKLTYHHRVVYCLAAGVELDSIDGMHVLHTCDNPRCVNPKHLFLGTHADNMKDKQLKGRATGMKGSVHHQAKLTEADIPAIRASTTPLIVAATKYGVSVSAISLIRSRRTWKHVPESE